MAVTLAANELVFLRARFYHPGTGRFLQRDPFGGMAVVPQSLNQFSYALNNLTTWSIPSGLSSARSL
jgi:RHS repeat-associated protein